MKIVLTGLALLVCFSRVVLGAHDFSDVLTGLGLAFFSLTRTGTVVQFHSWKNETLDFGRSNAQVAAGLCGITCFVGGDLKSD